MTDLHLRATPRGINVRVNIKQRRSCTAVQLGLLLKNPLLTLNTDASVRGQNVHKVFPSICFSTEAGWRGDILLYIYICHVLFFISHLYQDGTALWNYARHGVNMSHSKEAYFNTFLDIFCLFTFRLILPLIHSFCPAPPPACLPAYLPAYLPACLPTRLSSQATNASRIMFTVGKRAPLVSIEVPPVAEITKGQRWGIKGLHSLDFFGGGGWADTFSFFVIVAVIWRMSTWGCRSRVTGFIWLMTS